MSRTPRVLLVTGASRGIGGETARCAAERGYAVALNYSTDHEGARETMETILEHGGTTVVVPADISHSGEVARLFDEVEDALGPITDVVNNAGVMGGPCRLEALSDDELLNLFAINVFGTMYCCREAVRRIKARPEGPQGRIVNVSSVAAKNGSAGERVHYAASKGAINSFTLGLAKEVARENIRVNAFSPGVTWTTLNPPGRVEAIEPSIPAGRAGTSREMAKGILWLLSDEAEYCVGTNLEMSGGR